jgi:AmpE protein
MTLISILVCLALERWSSIWQKLRQHNWLVCYAVFIQRYFKTAAVIGSWPGLIVMLLPLVIVTALIQIGLWCVWYGILGWIFNTLVLLYCLGSHQLYEIVCKSLGKSNEPTDTAAAATASTTVATTDKSQTLSRFHQDVFGVIFWFCILGATGAVLYRAVSKWREAAIVADSELNGYFVCLNAANAWLNWIPVRLLGLSFALAGDFIPVFQAWIKHLWSAPANNEQLLQDCGMAAVKNQKELTEANLLKLAFRSLVVWLIVLALMTITAWIK